MSFELADQLAALVGEPVVVERQLSAGATRQSFVVRLAEDTPAVAQVAPAVRTTSFVLDVRAEVAAVEAAASAGVPVAAPLAHGPLASGAEAIVAPFVDGLTIPRHVLRSLEGAPGAGDRLTQQCGEALARLHAIPVAEVAALFPVDSPAFPARYVAELSSMLDTLEVAHPVLRYGINWLASHLPSAPDQPALVHGDFRNGNVVVAGGSEPLLAAVLDWELAHIGDPMEDLAYLCMRAWRFGADDLPVGGFGSLDTLRTSYERAGGAWRDDAFGWWTIARTAWWGIALAGQAQAFRAGDSTSIVHAASGRRVVEQEYDLLALIDRQH